MATTFFGIPTNMTSTHSICFPLQKQIGQTDIEPGKNTILFFWVVPTYVFAMCKKMTAAHSVSKK